MNGIIFLNEKVVNLAHEPWTEIPAGLPWTNPGGQHRARRSRGILALQGMAPRRGHRITERVTTQCSPRASLADRASEMGR
jgi:hypothetical protein